MFVDLLGEVEFSRTQRWSLFEAIGSGDFSGGSGEAGKRKGKAPVGEA